ncbi:MAG: type II secretion system protein [Acidobacteriaceae bacterium]
MKSAAPIRSGEQGFLLIGLLFMAALILIALAVAAPRYAKELQREREVETVHRGQQYVRAIQLYYRKFGSYPTSIDQLVKTNDIRFLRRRYINPITGKDDWRIIHLGEAKTQVTGFFGQPLGGAPTNVGVSASSISSMPGAAPGASLGSSAGSSAFGGGMGSMFGGQSGSTSPTGTTAGSTSPSSDTSGTTTGSSTATTGSGTSATTFGGSSGGPIVGVSVNSPKQSIIAIHQKTQYNQWEFLYDPRMDQQQMSNSLVGGSAATVQPGTGTGIGTGMGTGMTPGTGTGIGSSTSGIGGGSSSGPTTSSPTQSTTPQQ